ncbi:MAG TPA: fumarylacetoacetate hydrolase family protein [Bacillota bacterium]|nr:fumarylacetoacetate hydrolase family protein [Bacillota bacterium]
MHKNYVRFEHGGIIQYGIRLGNRVFAIKGDLFGDNEPTTVSFSPDEIRFLVPCQPGKIVCVGLNYRKHAEELGLAIPDEPVLFMKPPSTLLADGGEIIYWPETSRLDYEGELAIVMGKTCHRVSKEAALDHVFGYTIANDVTARDLQQKDGQWTRGKCFDTFLPLGPTITSGIDAADLALQTYLNGELRQDGRTSDLIFSLPFLVSFISHVMTLEPGDVIITGTPSGIGPMKVGDAVEVRIEGLGTLENTVRGLI